jgi:hypothetical protein
MISKRSSGSHVTPRWRELDSNDRYRLTRPRFQDRLMSPLMVSISGRKPPSFRRVLATGRRTSRSSRPLVECGKLTQAAALSIGARRRTQLIHRTPVAGCQTTSGTGGQFFCLPTAGRPGGHALLAHPVARRAPTSTLRIVNLVFLRRLARRARVVRALGLCRLKSRPNRGIR